jgi:hypothetical protein
MDVLKPTAEHIAAYVRFWIEFVYPPAGSLKEFQGSGTVQPQLIIYLAIGVLVAWLVGYVAGTFGMPDDPSATFQMAKGIGYDDIPRVGLAAILLTLLVSAAFHGLARLWIAALRWPDRRSGASAPRTQGPFDPHLGGNIYDTINSAVGFVAFFAPLGILIMAAALLLAQRAEPIYVIVPTVLVLLAVIFVYLPSALAATHQGTRYGHVLISLCGVATAIALLVGWLG